MAVCDGVDSTVRTYFGFRARNVRTYFGFRARNDGLRAHEHDFYG